jgi:hypothetical protein
MNDTRISKKKGEIYIIPTTNHKQKAVKALIYRVECFCIKRKPDLCLHRFVVSNFLTIFNSFKVREIDRRERERERERERAAKNNNFNL